MRLIDADALAETLGITDMSCERCAWYDRTKSLCGRGGDFADACVAIEDAPTVEERKVGKWVHVPGCCMPGGAPIWACSECGKGEHVFGIEYRSYGARIVGEHWVACPNCGARMEK